MKKHWFFKNAYPERLIGILEQEHGLGWTFKTKELARQTVEQATWIYNIRALTEASMTRGRRGSIIRSREVTTFDQDLKRSDGLVV